MDEHYYEVILKMIILMMTMMIPIVMATMLSRPAVEVRASTTYFVP